MAKIILLNKPFNVLCQFTDKEGRPTLADFVDAGGVYPAGRLDYDSEGLVVLTDDGQLQHQISHPDAKNSKTYWVQVEGDPSHAELEPLRKGIQLKDGSCRPAKAILIKEPSIWPRNPPVRKRLSIPTRWLELTISEGRNRQVRRMTAAIGFPTLRLIRTRVGDWSVEDLAPGEYRQLTVHAPTNNSAPAKRSTRRNRRL